MSESNGKPASPFRRALERHRAERAAWQRLQTARRRGRELAAVIAKEIAAALLEYEQFCTWGTPPGIDPLTGMLPDGPQNGQADQELAEAAAAFEPAEEPVKVPAKKRERKKRPEFVVRPGGGWNDVTIEAACRALGQSVIAIKGCGQCESLYSADKFVRCPDCETEEFFWAGALMTPKPAAEPPPAWLKSCAICIAEQLNRSPRSSRPPPNASASSWTGRCQPGRCKSRCSSGDSADEPAEVGLETELLHAVAGMEWQELIDEGAVNVQIRAKLEEIWPRHGRTFVPPDQSGGKTGYTITGQGGCPVFWLGAFKGPGHPADLAGDKLASRIRELLEIPTPAEAAKRAKDSFKEVRPTELSDRQPEQQPVKRGRGRPRKVAT